MILCIIWSNVQVIYLSEMGMVVLCTTVSYIRGSGSHISLENISTIRYMYCRGAIRWVVQRLSWQEIRS